jgi:hypothetical protein
MKTPKRRLYKIGYTPDQGSPQLSTRGSHITKFGVATIQTPAENIGHIRIHTSLKNA